MPEIIESEAINFHGKLKLHKLSASNWNPKISIPKSFYTFVEYCNFCYYGHDSILST